MAVVSIAHWDREIPVSKNSILKRLMARCVKSSACLGESDILFPSLEELYESRDAATASGTSGELKRHEERRATLCSRPWKHGKNVKW